MTTNIRSRAGLWIAATGLAASAIAIATSHSQPATSKRAPAVVGALNSKVSAPAKTAAPKKRQGVTKPSPISQKYWGTTEEVLANANSTDFLPFYVVLKAQASRQQIDLAAGPNDRDVAHSQVMALLKGVADESQPAVLAAMENQQSAGKLRNIRSLWIVNVIAAEGTPDAIRSLAARGDIAQVAHDPKRDISIAPVFSDEGGDVFPAATTCGLNLIKAPQVWSQLGITGVGSVIAVIDTGACRTHPDIANQIWSNPGEIPSNGVDDDGNGFIDDTWGWNFGGNNNNPNDNNGHGSHTAGTVGGDGTSGTSCGVAHNASVMVLRSALNLSSESEVWAAQQYAGMMKARSTSCSWGWIYAWNPNRPMHRNTAMNLIALGTACVIAAGNEGGGSPPNNLRTPGDVPEVITVGSVNCSDNISSFSSRGPVTWQGVAGFGDWPYPPGLIKPDVCAEGDATVSHNFCNGYVTLGGTSMATPHVAGTVALMCQANPYLRPMQIKNILRTTAVDRGATGPDNNYGWGRIDALAAVTEALNEVDRHYPESDLVTWGTMVSRNWLSDSHMNDDTYHEIRSAFRPISPTQKFAEIEYKATSRTAVPSSIDVTVENGASTAGVNCQLQLFDYVAGAWVTVDSRGVGLADGFYTVTIPTNAARFVRASTGETKARVTFAGPGASVAIWTGRVDTFYWAIHP